MKVALTCSTTRCLCAPFPFHTTASTILPSLNLHERNHRQTNGQQVDKPSQKKGSVHSTSRHVTSSYHTTREKSWCASTYLYTRDVIEGEKRAQQRETSGGDK